MMGRHDAARWGLRALLGLSVILGVASIALAIGGAVSGGLAADFAPLMTAASLIFGVIAYVCWVGIRSARNGAKP